MKFKNCWLMKSLFRIFTIAFTSTDIPTLPLNNFLQICLRKALGRVVATPAVQMKLLGMSSWAGIFKVWGSGSLHYPSETPKDVFSKHGKRRQAHTQVHNLSTIHKIHGSLMTGSLEIRMSS